MQLSPVLLWAPSAAFFLVTGIVAVRLLLLSRRTGELPERLMGAGLLALAFVYVPLMASTGMGRRPVGEVNLHLVFVATLVLWAGFSAIVGFTWKTFRPTEGWATVLMLALSSGAAAFATGLIGALYASPPEMSSFEAGKLWTGLLRIPMLASFAWTGVEGIRAYRMSRKRMALGLGDASVTNQFLLWGVIGCAQIAIHSVSLLLHFSGTGMMTSPTGLLVVALGSGVGAVCMYLVFMPPVAYTRWVMARAALPSV